jgi:mono/diheme cytochrome c family protein
MGGLRMGGISAPEYIKLSIIRPNDYIVDGYTAGSMYQDYPQHLTDKEIDAVVEYVMTR